MLNEAALKDSLNADRSCQSELVHIHLSLSLSLSLPPTMIAPFAVPAKVLPAKPYKYFVRIQRKIKSQTKKNVNKLKINKLH